MGNCTGGGGGQQKRAMDAKGGTLGNGDPRSIRSPMVAFCPRPCTALSRRAEHDAHRIVDLHLPTARRTKRGAMEGAPAVIVIPL